MKRIKETFEKGKGIFLLMPVFVPRRFSTAGQLLRLPPDDYYALGTVRGAIKERRFSSVIAAMNGPQGPVDEGLNYVQPFIENVQECGVLYGNEYNGAKEFTIAPGGGVIGGQSAYAWFRGTVHSAPATPRRP